MGLKSVHFEELRFPLGRGFYVKCFSTRRICLMLFLRLVCPKVNRKKKKKKSILSFWYSQNSNKYFGGFLEVLADVESEKVVLRRRLFSLFLGGPVASL